MSLTIWFTGLSGSGKTTLALALKGRLEAQGKTVEMLDGDVVREKLHRNLGFSREDIRTNNCLIAELAKKSTADFVLVPVISPYREDRKMARSIIIDKSIDTSQQSKNSHFIELFVNCPIGHCIKRDVKGLYQKALKGEITNFIGIAESNPYEPPDTPDFTVETHKESLAESTQKIIKFLEVY